MLWIWTGCHEAFLQLLKVLLGSFHIFCVCVWQTLAWVLTSLTTSNGMLGLELAKIESGQSLNVAYVL